jgi:heptosyltransferase-1
MSTVPVPPLSTFWGAARTAKRLLVLDLGFLGDTVHLIPALGVIRDAWSAAELHVMVAAHVTDLLQATPWVDQVWGYPRFPKGPKPWNDIGRVRALRAAGFDAVINLNGSDRSSFLTWLSGAPLRLGRCASVTLKKRLLFSHPLALPRGGQPVWKQHCECLKLAGIPCAEQGFRIEIPTHAKDSAAEKLGLPIGNERRIIHISPFTTQDQKELPAQVLATSLNHIHSSAPDLPVVVSCADNERERSKLSQLKQHLSFTPYRVFEGDLDLLELLAVLSVSRMHLGGDSGGLHLAVMAGAPTLSWFRDYAGAVEWMPSGEGHVVLSGKAGHRGIEGIHPEMITAEVCKRIGKY